MSLDQEFRIRLLEARQDALDARLRATELQRQDDTPTNPGNGPAKPPATGWRSIPPKLHRHRREVGWAAFGATLASVLLEVLRALPELLQRLGH
jgi:hypothetical protein